MTLETIKDILDWTRQLHEELARLYRDSSGESDDEKTRMLMTYVADHLERLAEAIAHYEKDSTVTMMDSWIQDYVEKNPFMQGWRNAMNLAGMNFDQVLDNTVKTHQQLIGLYEDLAEASKTERMKELFENLQNLEQHELMRMVHTTERFSDI